MVLAFATLIRTSDTLCLENRCQLSAKDLKRDIGRAIACSICMYWPCCTRFLLKHMRRHQNPLNNTLLRTKPTNAIALSRGNIITGYRAGRELPPHPVSSHRWFRDEKTFPSGPVGCVVMRNDSVPVPSSRITPENIVGL